MISAVAILAAVLGTHESRDVRCVVALSYVNDIVEHADSRKLVFSTAKVSPFSLLGGGWFERQAEIGHPKPAQAPPEDLVDQLGTQTDNAVVRCPSVRQFLRSRGIPYGAKAVRAVRTRGVFKAQVQTVSLPVVSEDQRRAVLARSEMRGFVDGGGWFELLERRPSGQWKVVAYQPRWMS